MARCRASLGAIASTIWPAPHPDLWAGRTFRLDDVLSDTRATGDATAAASARVGMRAGIAVPMIEDGHVTAALYVTHAEPRCWRDDETALIEEVVARTREAVAGARVPAGLQESEERFRKFAEHSTNVLWILNVEQDAIEYRSPAFERSGAGPPKSCSRDPIPWNGNLHPDDQEAARNALARILRGGSAVAHEYRIIRPDGSVRLIRDTCFPMRDDGGRLRRVAGIAQDVTPKAEALLSFLRRRHSEMRARAPFSSAPRCRLSGPGVRHRTGFHGDGIRPRRRLCAAECPDDQNHPRWPVRASAGDRGSTGRSSRGRCGGRSRRRPARGATHEGGCGRFLDRPQRPSRGGC